MNVKQLEISVDLELSQHQLDLSFYHPKLASL